MLNTFSASEVIRHTRAIQIRLLLLFFFLIINNNNTNIIIISIIYASFFIRNNYNINIIIRHTNKAEQKCIDNYIHNPCDISTIIYKASATDDVYNTIYELFYNIS